MAELKVTQFKSAIGSKPKQRGTLRALGLGRIGKTNTLPDRPEIRGMLAKVPHLVRVEEAESPMTIKIHDLQPAPGERKDRQPGRPRHRRPPRQDRRAAARRARAPATPSR